MKYKEYIKELEKEPLLFVLREKHGDNYYLCQNQKQFDKTILTIVSERDGEGYWYDEVKDLKLPEKPELSKDDIDKLPESKIKSELRKQYLNYESRIEEYEQDKIDILERKKIIKDKNYESLFDFLISRRGYEYEKFDIEIPTQIK